MEPNEITEVNKLIAEFMGWKIQKRHDPNCKNPDTLKWEHNPVFLYNSSWDWLMPVVDKVSEISATQQKENNLQLWMFLTADIENVWAKVVEFIKRQDNK